MIPFVIFQILSAIKYWYLCLFAEHHTNVNNTCQDTQGLRETGRGISVNTVFLRRKALSAYNHDWVLNTGLPCRDFKLPTFKNNFHQPKGSSNRGLALSPRGSKHKGDRQWPWWKQTRYNYPKNHWIVKQMKFLWPLPRIHACVMYTCRIVKDSYCTQLGGRLSQNTSLEKQLWCKYWSYQEADMASCYEAQGFFPEVRSVVMYDYSRSSTIYHFVGGIFNGLTE